MRSFRGRGAGPWRRGPLRWLRSRGPRSPNGAVASSEKLVCLHRRVHSFDRDIEPSECADVTVPLVAISGIASGIGDFESGDVARSQAFSAKRTVRTQRASRLCDDAVQRARLSAKEAVGMPRRRQAPSMTSGSAKSAAALSSSLSKAIRCFRPATSASARLTVSTFVEVARASAVALRLVSFDLDRGTVSRLSEMSVLCWGDVHGDRSRPWSAHCRAARVT